MSADTSYADPTAPDSRGRAVTAITIHCAVSTASLLKSGKEPLPARLLVDCVTQTHVRGVLHDGKEIDFYLPVRASDAMCRSALFKEWQKREDRTVGYHVGDGWWIKARLKKADAEAPYLISRGNGRIVEYRWLSSGEVSRVLSSG